MGEEDGEEEVLNGREGMMMNVKIVLGLYEDSSLVSIPS